MPTPLPMRFPDCDLLWQVEGVHSPDECAGLVAIFQPKVRHEGAEVLRGTKYAMRTDVLYDADDDIVRQELPTT